MSRRLRRSRGSRRRRQFLIEGVHYTDFQVRVDAFRGNGQFKEAIGGYNRLIAFVESNSVVLADARRQGISSSFYLARGLSRRILGMNANNLPGEGYSAALISGDGETVTHYRGSTPDQSETPEYYLTSAVADFEKSIAEVEAYRVPESVLHPGDFSDLWRSRFQLGCLHLSLHQFEKAEAWATVAKDAPRGSIPPPLMKVRPPILLRGVARVYLSKWEMALRDLTQGIEIITRSRLSGALRDSSLLIFLWGLGQPEIQALEYIQFRELGDGELKKRKSVIREPHWCAEVARAYRVLCFAQLGQIDHFERELQVLSQGDPEFMMLGVAIGHILPSQVPLLQEALSRATLSSTICRKLGDVLATVCEIQFSSSPVFLTLFLRTRICHRCRKWSPFRLSRCSGCNLVRYCDRNCQRADWADHKKNCHRRSHSETN